jgi:hypothetical protein
MPDDPIEPILTAAQDGSPPVRVARGPYRLRTREGIRNAVAALIRQAIAGTRPSEEMSRIVGALKVLDDMLGTQEFEQRVAALERASGLPASTVAGRLWR